MKGAWRPVEEASGTGSVSVLSVVLNTIMVVCGSQSFSRRPLAFFFTREHPYNAALAFPRVLMEGLSTAARLGSKFLPYLCRLAGLLRVVYQNLVNFSPGSLSKAQERESICMLR